MKLTLNYKKCLLPLPLSLTKNNKSQYLDSNSMVVYFRHNLSDIVDMSDHYVDLSVKSILLCSIYHLLVSLIFDKSI